MSYELHGNYKIDGDTIILNSDNDFITVDNKRLYFKNEKWIIINDNKIRTGTDYNPNTIYVGGFIERKDE